MAIDSAMRAILPVDCNDELEFIVVAAKRLEICPKISNFSSNGATRFSTCLHTLAMISRASYTSTLA
jgi:hypothetical protein